MNASSRGSTWRTSVCLPFISTMHQAMISTTTVRMAVPRFDSTPEMPILARMDVSAANTAETTA